MKSIVKEAFLKVRGGYSPDRVVADPDLNKLFLEACRSLDLDRSARELNSSLINLRKACDLPGLKSKRTSFRDQDEYSFASEIAIRFMERRDGVTLDQVVCDPALAAEFDRVAERIVPGYSPLRYRWAALALRKSRRLCPEPLGQALRPVRVCQFETGRFDINEIPPTQGLYVFFEATKCLYVGEAKNLNKRIRKHLAFSDNRGIAYWLWEHGTAGLHLEVQVLDPSTLTRTRKAMEHELKSRGIEYKI